MIPCEIIHDKSREKKVVIWFSNFSKICFSFIKICANTDNNRKD